MKKKEFKAELHKLRNFSSESRTLPDTDALLPVLAHLLQFDLSEVEKNPDLLVPPVKKVIAALRDFLKDLENPANAKKKLTAIWKQYRKSLEAGGVDISALRAAIPAEAVDAWQRRDVQKLQKKHSLQLRKAVRALDEILEKDHRELRVLTQDLEKQLGVFNIELTEQKDTDFRAEMQQEMEELRKGKEIVDFTFDDLWDAS